MKTEEVIQWFQRDPFKCTGQTTLVRARDGVLMARRREVSRGLIYKDSKNPSGETDIPVIGSQAKAHALVEEVRHPVGKVYDDPNAFFVDDDMLYEDWVPLVVAIPEKILGPEVSGPEGNPRNRWFFIGALKPGDYNPLFGSCQLFSRRDAAWAYDTLYDDCIIHVPQAAMFGVGIPSRSRRVDPMNILLRVFHKIFIDVCGEEKSERNWQLGWAYYLTNNCAIRVNTANTFGAKVTGYLNSAELSKLESSLAIMKEAALNQDPTEYVDKWVEFSKSLCDAYSADRIDTDVTGVGTKYVLSHIDQELFPVHYNSGYHSGEEDLYKFVDKDWRTHPTHDQGRRILDTDEGRLAYEEACRSSQRTWDRLLRRDSLYSRGDRFMGLSIPSFTLLRRNWCALVDLFERLGFTEPKPFGFSLTDENEESLAVLREAAATEMADPAATIEDAAEAEAESTMTLLG